ncbi:MAG: hypothetical protein LBV33_00475 [Lachnospiraceae bacterium]|jgi:hypothetical protein|nr:hypothetical protein [Lachnospiraceae bacterium]
MPIKPMINAVRLMPDHLSLKREFICSIYALLLGLIVGVVAKATDSISIIGEIGTLLGVWIFIATLIAAFSKSPFLAALNTLLFFLAVLAAYYSYTQLVFGFFPRSYFFGWFIIALLSPAGGSVVWFSRGKGWFAMTSAALPIALLLAEGYPAYYTYQIAHVFDLCCAAVLLIVLPKIWKQRMVVLMLSIVLTVIISRLNIYSLFPW